VNARKLLTLMVRTDRGSMTVWSPSEVSDALDAFHAEVTAERDAMTVAWLVKKAREFRAMGGRMRAAQADAVAAMASKIERGAVRPNNLRTLPADFFEPGHTYRAHFYGGPLTVDYVGTHPATGERYAHGWVHYEDNDSWAPNVVSGGLFEHFTDITERGDA
jgi:hypothetical protein